MDLIGIPRRSKDDDAYADDRGALMAPALARAIVAAVFCGFAGIALMWVLHSGAGIGGILLAVALLAGLLGLQYFYFGRPGTDLHSPASYVALAAQACLSYLPLLLFGQSWVSQPSFLAGSVLLVLPLRVAWLAYAGVVASTGFLQFLINGALLDTAYIVVNTATAGLAVYGLIRLAHLVTALYEARHELANTAVAHERLRLARDLHDLLGRSLSAIALKGALALRLLPGDPVRAEQELSGMLETSRRALTDVRSIARAYREIPLDDETGTLASMLASSQVELRTDLDYRELAPNTRGALSAVLREGVASMLRHHETGRCEIVLQLQGDEVSVEILGNGAGAVPAGAGGGLDALSALVSKVEGELSAGVAADGRFRLHVVLPMRARPMQRPAGDVVDEPGASIPHIATKLAGALLAAVLVGLFVQAVLRPLYGTQELREIGLATGYLLAALALQLACFSRPGLPPRPPVTYLLLGLQAVVVYLPMAQLHAPWAGLQGFLAGSALLVLRPAIGWSVFGAVAITVAWAQAEFAGSRLLTGDIAQILITIDIGLVVYGLTRMARTVRQLRAARQRLAEVALAEERLRFARDLHDLLGLSLSAITLKSDLAHRLIPRDPARARTVLAQVLELCRHALADVRSVAGDHRALSLPEECRTAESLLTAAGLQVRITLDHGDLPATVATVLATVLREGVTNVLRHSTGTRCDITIRRNQAEVFLHMTNDGATAPAQADHHGSGIRNMADRVAVLGGTLTARHQGDGRFELQARIPLSGQSTLTGGGLDRPAHGAAESTAAPDLP
ncbi:sensor histidine kinase [Thermoactinospora rubra]|uniref:sensor histidine kinase n=1 Tax=Thermoactinospora rubra TaxID=1088767 RepID=UPI001301ABE6|nr:histidine kinase [Thermoactinospora rubra]